MDPITMLGLGGLALTLPGTVGAVASGIDNWTGTDLTRRKYRARRGLGAMSDIGAMMATQGFDGAVDALSLEAGLDSVPLNMRGGAVSRLGMADQTFLHQLIAMNQESIAAASGPAPLTYAQLMSLAGGTQ